MRNNVEVIPATASFVGPDTIRLEDVDGGGSRVVKAKKIVIAAGAETTRDPHIPFDGEPHLYQRRRPRSRSAAADLGRGRRRGDRLRVRQHLRRARGAGHPDRPARPVVAVRRQRDRRRILPPSAREPGHLAAQRERRQIGDRRGRARRAGQDTSRQRQDDHRRKGALFGRPHRRHQPAQSGGSRSGRRQPRSPRRRRELPHRGRQISTRSAT